MIKLEKVTFKSLRQLNVRDRINAVRDPGLGAAMLNALSPTDIAMLFPRYYLEYMPDVSGFMKAVPSAASQARQQYYDEQIKQAASGETRPLAGKPGGWLEKFREKVSTATVTKKPTLTTEQQEVLQQIRSGQISADDPRAKFIKDLPADKKKEYRIEEVTDESGKKFFKSSPVEIAKEDVQKRLEEESGVVGKHAALKALIAKKEHGIEGDAAYDVIYRHGKGVMNPPKPIHEMTLAEVLAFQHEAKAKAGSDAFPVGKYQFVEKTLRDLMNRNHLDPNTTYLTKEMQEKFANQLIDNRGGNIEGLRSEWDALKRFASEKEIAGALEVDKNAPAVDPSLSDQQKFDKMLEVMRRETDNKVRDSMAEYIEKNKPSGLAAPTDGKLSVVGRAAQVGSGDPRLQDILNDASKYLPEGYTVQLYSGYRPGDSRFHGKGMAADVRIVDPQGNIISNYQDPKNFRIYEQFAQAARKVQHEKHPDLEGAFRWGGYFSGGAGKYGAMDLMHFDLGGHSVGMAGGSWEKGLTEQQKSIWGGTPVSQGMGKVTDFKLPEAPDAKTKISEATPEQEKQLREDFYRSEKNPFARKPAAEIKQEQGPPQPDVVAAQPAKAEPTVTQPPEAKPAETPKPSEPAKAEPAKQEAPKAEPAKPTEPPKQESTPIEAKKVQSVSVKAKGGKEDLSNESQLIARPINSLQSDNTLVVDQNNTPKFTMNTDKEAAVYDPNKREVNVIPTQKTDGNILDMMSSQVEQAAGNVKDELTNIADSLRSEFQSMLSDQDKRKPPAVTHTISDRDPDMITKLGTIVQSPSATRAFSRARFVETGSAIDDFHSSGGNKNVAT